MTIIGKAEESSFPQHRSELRDFNADPRILILSGMALLLGVAGACLAWLLLHLIYGATSLFYYHRLSWAYANPAGNHLGWVAVFIPVMGGLIIGVMARYGSPKIRGHGMPEAIEAILINGAKVDAKTAFFKPISAAVAIGSGGPFGAEGPIIMTAGAAGSLFAQLFRLSDAERTTLLVAGAAAGMAGVFATPLSAILLGVELLLFEWKPRSLVPVAVAATTSGALRRLLLGAGPLFPMTNISGIVTVHAVLAALVVGVLGGALALLLSRAVYASEDLFDNHLPVHWMWWPAIGGVVIGIGGLIYPHALGTGYDVIAAEVGGNHTWQLIFGVLIVKSIIWSFSLGSGTSGGILAPLLMIGGAMGALLAPGLPVLAIGAWPLVGMAAVLSGAIGCPLTAAVLAMELTHNYGLILPLLAGSVTAHAFTVLFQKRSILTERLSRRGLHLSREYSVDPLETMTVSQVMQTGVATIAAPVPAAEVAALMKTRLGLETGLPRYQRLFPVTDRQGTLLGIIRRGQIAQIGPGDVALEHMVAPRLVVTPHQTLRTVAEIMSSAMVTAAPVVDRDSNRLLGLISFEDMLRARARSWERENLQRRGERMRFPFASATRVRPAGPPEPPAGATAHAD